MLAIRTDSATSNQPVLDSTLLLAQASIGHLTAQPFLLFINDKRFESEKFTQKGLSTGGNSEPGCRATAARDLPGYWGGLSTGCAAGWFGCGVGTGSCWGNVWSSTTVSVRWGIGWGGRVRFLLPFSHTTTAMMMIARTKPTARGTVMASLRCLESEGANSAYHT